MEPDTQPQDPQAPAQAATAVVIQSTQRGGFSVTPVDAQGQPGKAIDAQSLDDALDAARQALGGDEATEDQEAMPDDEAAEGDDAESMWDQESKARGAGIYEGR